MHHFKNGISVIICTLVLVSISTKGWCKVDFDKLHGSDLGMGIGARAIAMAGAFAAVSDDASAVFWNPSGLTQLSDNQLFLSMDLPTDISSAAFIYKPNLAKLKDIDFTMGMGFINRLNFKGDSGSDTWEGYSANLLDMAMIDINDDFSGEIESDTYDVRLSMAMTPESFKQLSLGINLAFIT
ncbi:MAG: hypothetical protein PVI90_13050 [Desulfobacteraceae bacterium]|jgi:hypothetical protein